MLESFHEFAAAVSQHQHERACAHLLRADHQEDVTFALWIPSEGHRRLTALLSDLVLPRGGERIVHGNVEFTDDYFVRAIGLARQKGCGLALIHSHPSPGWQRLSSDDYRAESGRAGAVQAATDLPFVGLTVGSDGSWSGRFWQRVAPRTYSPAWMASVRVAGRYLIVSYNPDLRPEAPPSEALRRTVGVWGHEGQAQISRLRIGIVGLGSVGSMICEGLARMGVEWLDLIDYDIVEELNLDRILGAGRADVGRKKVDVAADNALRSATARSIRINRHSASVVERDGYRTALSCDLLFSCVDRPWPRRVLNHIAYAHLLPVIDGGILVRVRGDRLVGADWHVHTVGPGRRCLECWEAFDPSLVGIERDGLLDDPSYIRNLDPAHQLLRHENVFPFSLSAASLELMQMASLIVGPVHDLGDQNYHYSVGKMDHHDDAGCRPSCVYPPLLATGDTRVTVTGLDHGAEKQRRTEERVR